MPNRTIYWTDDQEEYIDALVKNGPGIDNRSQAVQYLINQAEQRDIIEAEQ